MANFSIRNQFQPGDLSQVALLHAKIYYGEQGFGIGFEAYMMESLVEFYLQYDEEKDRVWVVKESAFLIGFLLLMHRQANQALLRYFILEKNYRGPGIGQSLMKEWIEFYRAKDYESAYLYTTSGLESAVHLYESFGYQKISAKASDNFGVPLNEIRFELN